MDSEESYLRLQQDLDQLGKWADEWQAEFNSGRYKVMYYGQAKMYTVNGRTLGNIEQKLNRKILGYKHLVPSKW